MGIYIDEKTGDIYTTYIHEDEELIIHVSYKKYTLWRKIIGKIKKFLGISSWEVFVE